jgi:hypothetical protein
MITLSNFSINTCRHLDKLKIKIKMGFGDLKSRAGLQTLNNFLETRSYIEGLA